MTFMPLYEFNEETRGPLVRMHLEGDCRARVISQTEGTFGEVYRLDAGMGVYPRFLAAKCPKISRFGSRDKASAALENVLHEVDKTFRLLDCPWVNRFVDIRLIHGWPFLISQWRDGTLSDLIASPQMWTDVDRIVTLIQIVRVLRMAAERGIGAHQDLKPDNIFFVDVHRKFRGASDAPGMHFQILVGDFGNADAFREFGRNTGSRPYMAPEQFGQKVLEPTAGGALDIFAVGVIAHECFCDGRHPIGEVTADVWPRKSGVSRRWGEASPWRNWAELQDKDLGLLRHRCPEILFPLLSAALAPDPTRRPDPASFEAALWNTLEAIDSIAHRNVRFQVEQLESMYAGNEWPHYEERLASLRNFYAQRG